MNGKQDPVFYSMLQTGCINKVPVSYTHLDVYKRQVLNLIYEIRYLRYELPYLISIPTNRPIKAYIWFRHRL